MQSTSKYSWRNIRARQMLTSSAAHRVHKSSSTEFLLFLGRTSLQFKKNLLISECRINESGKLNANHYFKILLRLLKSSSNVTTPSRKREGVVTNRWTLS